MPDLTPDQAIQTLKGLPEDRQRAILAKLPADVKQGIMAKLSAKSSAPPAVTPSAPTDTRNGFQKTVDGWFQPGGATAENTDPQRGYLSDVWNVASRAGQNVAGVIAHPVQAAQGTVAMLNEVTNMEDPQFHGPITQRIKEFRDEYSKDPRLAVDNMAGDLAGMYATGKLGDVAAENVVGPIARGLKDKVVSARDSALGQLTKTSPKETADLVKETKEANETDAAKVAKTNADQEAKRQADLREHFEKTQKVKQANAEAEAGPERKEALTHGVERLDTEFQNDLKQTAKDVKTKADDKYSTVRDALGPKKDAAGKPIPGSAPTVPSSELASAVRTAEGKIEGSSENLKIFRDILSKHPEDDPDFVNYQGADIPRGHALYDVLKEQGGMGSDTPATFSDLQGYYTELGDKISGGKLPGDVYQAMKSLHESIGKVMQKMADDHQVGPQLKDAQSYYANYMRTFRDPNSPLYKSIKATERGKSIAALAGKDQTGIEALAKYNPELASRANTVRGYQSEAKSIPAKPKVTKPLPELPEKPTPITSSPKTISAEDIRTAKSEGLQDRADFIKRRGGQIAATFGVYRILESVIHGNLGELPSDFTGAVVGYGATQAIGKLLEVPAVRDFLTKPTERDLAQIPASMRGDMSQIVQIAKSKGIKVDPKLAVLLGAVALNGPKTQKLQQARDHARFAHVAVGPDGHRIGSNDGQTWVDTETGEPVHAQ